MTFINYSSREINCKVVYYGPGLCGKTTNLQYVYDNINAEAKGKMISLATETERTLFFDFLPLALGKIEGFKTRLHLYTVPGQIFYNASRKLIIKGVDGIVFVADSQESRLDANVESYENLQENLAEIKHTPHSIPFVVQYNKRDLPNILSPEEIRAEMGIEAGEFPEFEAVAIEGKGVFETLKAISKLILTELTKSTQSR
ncbi:MAG: gliding-motility protein MglA [Deltaproteobacteria bacterium]|nr:MAG: gliding-motility protein MglA [Deltaproteobacteria bacterium]